MKKRTQFGGLFLVAALVVITVLLVLMFGFIEKLIGRDNKSPESLNYTDSGDSRIYYNDTWYTRSDSIKTLLVLGIDKMADNEDASSQADFIALVVMDEDNKSFRILHINRDTMTEVNQLDKHGNKYGSFKAQLALAHAYGGTGKIQCRNTVASVEKLLYEIDIDHYMSVTMDAVPIINDSIGGVTLTLDNDYPALGSEYVKGAQITLVGEAALSFVRWRNDSPDGSNLERMERQRAYIAAAFSKYASLEDDLALDTMFKVNEYLVSDCTVNQLSDLLESLQGYTYNGTFPIKGEAKKGSEYVEFYVDEDALKQTVIDLFYEQEV